MLLHGLQQGRLHLGRRTVDFIRQDEVRENRPEFNGKLFVFLAVNQGSRQVGRQQVRRELNPAELRVDRIGQRIDRQRLGQPRNPFEQNVPIAEQSDQQTFHKVFLTDDHFAHLQGQQIDERALLFDAGVELLNVYGFAHIGYLVNVSFRISTAFKVVQLL